MSPNELTLRSAVSDENGGVHPATTSQFAKTVKASPIQIDFGQLGRPLVKVAQELARVAGVRLWRMLGSEPTVLHQSGKLPLPDKAVVEKISQSHATGRPETSQWTHPLRLIF